MSTKAEWRKLLAKYSPSKPGWKPSNIVRESNPLLQNLIAQLPACGAAIQEGWRVYVVDQRRGRCYYLAHVLTIPLWVVNKPRVPGHSLQYLAHETAHAYARGEGHGAKFMHMYKQICPAQLQYLEHSYQPRSAAAAGVPMSSTILSQNLPRIIPVPFVPHVVRKLAGETLRTPDVLLALQELGGFATIQDLATLRSWAPVRIHGAFLALKAQGHITYANKTATVIK